MTDKIQEIRKALEAATPGELHNFNGNIALTSDEIIGSRTVAMAYDNSFAEIFANAPEWLSYLLTELDAAKQENERLKNQRTFMVHANNNTVRVNGELRQQLKQAIEALELYANDESFHCGNCDQFSYDTGSGDLARETLKAIREEAGKEPSHEK